LHKRKHKARSDIRLDMFGIKFNAMSKSKLKT
ncbi:hypothetical protein T10_6058, partial [Trichinella papuae]